MQNKFVNSWKINTKSKTANLSFTDESSERHHQTPFKNVFKTVHLGRELAFQVLVQTTYGKTMDSLQTFHAYILPTVGDRISELVRLIGQLVEMEQAPVASSRDDLHLMRLSAG